MPQRDFSGGRSRRGSQWAGRRYGDLMVNAKDIKVTMNQATEEAPQCPEDRRGPDFSNNTPRNSWLIGANEDATSKPNFDHSPPRSKMRR